MGLGKFPQPQPDMRIPAVSYCYHGDGSGESIPDGDLPIAILTLSLSIVCKRRSGTQPFPSLCAPATVPQQLSRPCDAPRRRSCAPHWRSRGHPDGACPSVVTMLWKPLLFSAPPPSIERRRSRSLASRSPPPPPAAA
jgi:hypothetical protein